MKKYLYKETSATFLVDAQKGFTSLCPDELPVPKGELIGPECNKTFEKTKFKVASKDAHPHDADWLTEDRSHVGLPAVYAEERGQHDLYWPRHCEVGTYGFELLSDLPSMEEFDFIIYKGVERHIHVYSAVYQLLKPNNKGSRISTGVIEFFKANRVDTVVIVGLATNYCCASTAFDLVEAGFRVIMNLGGCRGIGDIKPALKKMEESGVEFVNTADELECVNAPKV
jgi:nicotinamidase/pyrazinamidase